MPNGCLNTHAQWIYQYSFQKYKPTRPVAVSQPLTIFTNSSILDAEAVLDPPLIPLKLRKIYTNMLDNNNHIIQSQYRKLIRPVVIPKRLKSRLATIQILPKKCKPIHPMVNSAMSIHTPSGNRNIELVNTHINIRPVAIL